MEQAAMELINVTKTIGKKKIIKGLSFEINKGEVFGFIGPNGAGKTTTIRMMVGLMKLTEGDVLIQGHSIKTDFQKAVRDRKSTCLNSSHVAISYAVFCLKKKRNIKKD